MGNQFSHKNPSESNGIFTNELTLITEIVNKIINDKDMFNNSDYNFLSEDVCAKHNIVLEQELNKHLKIELESLGTSLYIIPKGDDHEKLTKINLTKKQICQKISNHYIKILYIICLIKYVYDLEHNGDLSIAGIIFRNIKILDNIMEIDFCQIPHKDYKRNGKDITKINLGLLEGINFFTGYFLEPEESRVFLGLMKNILARKKETIFTTQLCSIIKSSNLTSNEIKELEKLYYSRYNTRLTCKKTDKLETESPSLHNHKNVNLDVFIEKDNPIFNNKMCYATNQLVIKLNNSEGRKVESIYKKMKSNYDINIKSIKAVLDKLVLKNGNGEYILRDIKSTELQYIISDVKLKIKTFYMQSILDFQLLFDTAKTVPNIHMISDFPIRS
jgi:hypothetical protein